MTTQPHDIQDELEGLAPTLATLRRTQGSTPAPPDGYLDQLADAVWPKLHGWREVHTSRHGWRRLAAAAVALLLGTALWLWWPSSHADNGQAWAPNEAQRYIQDHLDDFDAGLIWEVLSDEDFDNLPADETLPPSDSTVDALEEIMPWLNVEDLETLL